MRSLFNKKKEKHSEIMRNWTEDYLLSATSLSKKADQEWEAYIMPASNSSPRKTKRRKAGILSVR